MRKKYLVTLTAQERELLWELTKKPRIDRKVFQRAQILLKADQALGAPAWTDAQLAEAFDVSVRTVERLRQQFAEVGLEQTLRPPKTPRRPRKVDGAAEARLVALACSAPPEGFARWTLRLLAERLVELEIVESLSHEHVRRVLKKTNYSLTGASAG